MAEGSGSQKVNPNLVAEIVSSYVAKNGVAVDQMGGLIAAIHVTLSGLGSAEPTLAPATLTPAPSCSDRLPDYLG
jgi:predicted transcriptional regulator